EGSPALQRQGSIVESAFLFLVTLVASGDPPNRKGPQEKYIIKTTPMYLLYSVALALAAALALPFFLLQALRHGKYWCTFRSRWGRIPSELAGTEGESGGRLRLDGAGESGGGLRLDGAGAIWIHAVSVGEVLACPRLVAELRAKMPGRRIVVSTTTSTGQDAARKRLAADGFFYCPFDFAFAVRRVLAGLRPAMLVVAETELWPNLLHEARAAGAKVAVVNAR